MSHRLPLPVWTLQWFLPVLLASATGACRDDLLPTEPIARSSPPDQPAPWAFAYQLRGDPWISLLAQRSGHDDISQQLDNALFALGPSGGGVSSAAPATLRASRRTLEPADRPDPREADLLSAVLGFTVGGVTTVIDQLTLGDQP